MGQDEEVLVREIGKLAGFFGGFGARFAARRLPVVQHEAAIELEMDSLRARDLILRILGEVGRPVDQADNNDVMSAIVGSGHLNMNPTILHLTLSATSADRCRVLITGLAKEGLIKQNAARKAVERLSSLLLSRDALPHPFEHSSRLTDGTG